MANFFKNLFFKSLFSKNKSASPCPKKIYRRRLELEGMEPRITPATISIVDNQVVLTLVNGEDISNLNTALVGNTLTITNTSLNNNTSSGVIPVGITVNDHDVVVDTTNFTTFAGLVVNAAGGSQPVTVVVNSSGIDLSAVPGNANQSVSIDLSLSADPADSVTVNSAIKTKGTGTVDLNATTISLAAAGDITTNAGNVDITGPTKIGTAGDITSGGNITFHNALTLTDDIILTGNTPTFTGGVTGANHDLTLNFSGTTTIGANFTGIKNLTTNSGGTTSLSGIITTTGNQIYNDAVTLGANTTLNSGGSNILFGSTLNGTFNLGLSAGAGTISGTSVNISNLTITNCTSATFTGAVTVNHLITTANPYSVSMTGTGNTFALNVDFLNSGLVTLGDGAGTDTFLFNTGLNFTGNAASNVGGAINTSGDVINFGTSGVTLVASSSVNSTVGGAGAGITFGGKLDGTFDLSLTAGSGTITFTGLVGDTAPLSSLTVLSAGDIAISTALKAAGLVAITGNEDVNVFLGTAGAGLSLADAELNFITTTGGLSITASGFGNMTVNNVTAGGAISGTTTLTAGGTGVTFATKASTFNNALTIASPAIVGVNIITSNAALTFNKSVTLTAITILNSGSGDILFGSTVDGTFALTANSSGTTTFSGIVGGTVPLASLVTNAGGTTVINGGAITTTTTQTYNDAVSLGTDTILTGTIPTFTGGVTGAGYDLILNFSGLTTIGATFTGIKNLTTDGGGTTSLSGAITTTGFQTFNHAVTLSADTTLTGTTPTFAAGVTGGGKDLTLNFNGLTTIGATFTGIKNLATNGGGTTSLSGAIATTGTQTYNDAVTLNDDTTLSGTTPTFTLGVNGSTSGFNRSLTLTFSLPTTIGANFTGIRNLTSNGGSTTSLSGTITTIGTQTYSDAVILTADTTLIGTIPTFTLGVTGAGYDLNLNFSGTTTIGALFTGIKNLTTNNGGTTSLSGAITTTGNQTYNDAVILSAATTLNSGGSNIVFGSTLNGAFNLDLNAGAGTISGISVNINNLSILSCASATFTGTVIVNDLITTANPYDISLTGTSNTFTQNVNFLNSGLVTLGEAAGTDTFLFNGGLNFTGNAPSIVGGASISSSGDVINFGTGGVTAISNIIVNSTVGGVGAGITFGGKLDGTFDLSLIAGAGTITFTGLVGDTAPLNSLTVSSAGDIAISAALKAAGLVSITGNSGVNVFLGTTGAGLSLVDAELSLITTTGDLLITASGIGIITVNNVTGGGTISGTTTLTAGGTGVTFASTASTFDNALTIASPAIIGVNISTSNDALTFNNPVTLSGNSTLTSGTGLMLFEGTVNGAFNLIANSSSDTTFSGIVGGTAALKSISTNAGGTTYINTSAITTTGNQSYNDAVTLSTNNTMTSSNNILFANSLKGAFNLGLNAGAGAGLIIGTSVNINNLTITNGASAAFTGAVTVNDLITTANPYTISMTGIGNTFAQNVDFLNSGAIALGDTSDTFAFSNGFTFTGNSPSDISAIINSGGIVNFGTGGVTLLTNSAIATTQLSAAGQNILFGAAIGGAFNLELDAGTGGAITGKSVTINDLTISNGASAAFTGAVKVNDLITTATATSISMTGTGNTFAQNVDFLNSGLVTLGGVAGTETFLFNNGLNFTGNAASKVGGFINSSGDVINFGTGGVTLVLSSSVNSTVGGGGADITFGGLVAVTADNAQALTVNASTNNIITFGDDVGAPALRLSALTLTANSVKYGGDVYVASSTNFGNVVLTANQTFTTNGTASIETVNGSGFNMNIVAGDLALTGDVTNIGTLSIENISAAGTITLMGSGGLAIETQAEWNFIQPSVNFVVLGNTLTNVGVIDVAAAWINNRAVTVDFKSGGAGKFNVNGVITGAGNFTVNGSGNSTNINADITQASINITDSVVVEGGVLRILTATAAGGVVIDSTGFVNGISANAAATSLALATIFATAPISLTGTLTSAGGSALTDLTMGGNSVIAGTVTLSASGSIDGDLSLGNSSGIDLDSNAGTLSAKSMTFGVATTLTGSTSLQTTAGNISFGGALNGSKTIGLTAVGDINFTGAVGAVARLGDLTVTSAATVLATSSVKAASFTQAAGSVATTFTDLLDLTGSFDFTGTILNINGVGSNLVGTTMDVTNSNLFTTANGANLSVGTEFVQDGAGFNSIGGNIASTSDGIAFATGVTLTNDLTMTTGLLAGDDISFGSTLNGAQALGLTAGAGTIDFIGAVGGTPLTSLTIASAGDVNIGPGITASGLVSITSNTNTNVTLGTTTGGLHLDIGEVNAITAGSLSITAAGLGTMIVDGMTSGGVITGVTTLTAGGTGVTFSGVASNFNNALTVASPSILFVNVSTSDDAMIFNAVTLGASVSLNTNAITPAGNLTLGAVTGTFDLNLDTGATGSITGTSVNINDLTIANGASAAFTDAVTVNNLITTANPYSVSMTGTGNTFALNVDFLNTGLVTLGDATTDTFAFDGGLTFTGGAASNLGADITSGGVVNFGTGGVTLTAGSTVATTQLSVTGQNIIFGAGITDGASSFDLGLDAGTGGAITGTSVNINDLTIANGASAAFTDAVTVHDLITTANPYSVSMTGTGNTFALNVDFLNSGLVTLGGVAGTDTFLFKSGLNFTGNAASKVGGFINSSGDDINFGTGGVTLVASSSVNSAGEGSGADITFGGPVAVTADNAQALTVNASTNNIITFGDDIGAPALRLSALTLTANSVNYGGDVYVASSTNFGNVVLTTNQTFTTNGTASFGTIDGAAFNMNIVAGDLALTGDVTNIGTLSIENISAAGTITLMGTGGLAIETQTEWNFIQPTVNFVVLGNTLTNVGVIDVAAAWINNRAVTVDFKSGGAGKFNVNGAITTTTGLGSLTVNGSGNSTNINADITQASINITDSVVVDGGVLRILTATAVGGVVIDSTGFVNGISANAPATSLALTTIFATAPISLTGTLTNTGGNFLTDLQMGGNSVIAGTVTLSASGSIDGDLSLGNSSGIDLDSNAGILSAKSMGFGVATSLTGSTSLQTTAGDISFNDAIFGGANSLTLNASGTILATSLLTTNDLTITNSNGTTFTGTVGANNVVITDSSDASTVAFQDNLAITTGMTVAAGGAYNVSITGFSNSIAGDTNFLNTGSVTIGQVIGTSSFLGGLDTTAASSTNIAGTVETTNTAMDLGATTLADNATLRSGSGPINVASITDGANSFALGMGNGTQTGTITITGNTTVDSLNTSAGAYSIELTGAANTIIINTNFLNTGSVTIGQALGTSSFVGGLNTTAASYTNFAGVVQTTNSQINLGSTILLANASLLSGSGQILAASITDGASSFALSLGNASQTGTITVTGNTSVDTLNTGAGAYSIELTGATNTITTNTNFLNTVSVTLGDSAGTDSFLFDGGLNFTGNAASKLGGFINSSGDAINFGTGPGGVTLTANSTIASTTTSPAGANIIFGSGITGAFDLGLDAGTGGAITGTSVAINDLTVTNGASAAFTGAVTINDLITTAKPYSVSMTGTGNTFAQNLNFANSGLVTLGDGTDTFLLNNGLTFGGNAASKLGGTINSSGDVINFGTGGSTLTNNSTVATITSSPAGAAILFGAGITGAFNLGLDAGTGGAITGTSVAINDLTINNGASAAFTGAVTVNDLITTTNPYSVSMTGTGNTFAQNVEFLNTGTVALNNAISDSSTFAGGLVVTAPSSITMKGTVAATNSNMILGDSDTGVILGTNTTLNAGTGNINLNGVVSGAFSLTPITATPGLTTIAGANTNTTTNVTTGVVQINNSLPQTTNYAVSGGTLKGTGAIGALTGTGTGIIAPGNSPGQVTTTNLSLTSTNTLQIELTGTTPGTQYDQIVVNPGTVTLDNAILTLSSTYAGSAGAVFTIIDNQGIAAIGGTFVGLPEGSVISTSGRAYKISYVGGTGNDVTLTAIPTVTLNIADLDITTTTLTITGTGFDTTPGNNTVTFNDGAIGTVNSATSTQLNIIFSTQPTGTGSLTAVVITNSISSGAPIQVATVVTTPTPTPTPTIVTGTPPPSSGGSSTVTIYDPATGQPSGTVVPFPGFSGELRVVSGDFNGDGIMDILAAAGPGGGPAIAVLNSQTGAVMESFFAFDPAFTGGVFVAVSDFNGDGILDIIAGAGAGGGPEVRIFDGSNLNILKAFFAYDQSFTGGVTVAAQDFNADGILDIVTGAGAGGAPHVKVFDGATNSILSQWYAYPISFTGGVYVAAGDISNDGNVEVVTGAGMGGSPVVAVWDPYTGALLSQFMAYAEDFTGGVRVGVSDGNGDGIRDLITGAGPGGGPEVKGFSFPALDLLFSFYSGDSTNTGGVFVS